MSSPPFCVDSITQKGKSQQVSWESAVDDLAMGPKTLRMKEGGEKNDLENRNHYLCSWLVLF